MALIVAAATAFWLGILTSISPCPLATNVAAISFIGRRMGSPPRVFLDGLSYTLGRALAYLLIAGILVTSLLSAPQLSQVLQQHVNKFIGPLLVLVGMVLLELISLPNFGLNTGQAWQKRMATLGVLGPCILGCVFALSFCPVSAALFFGSLLPLALDQESPWLLPAAYGIGTGLPVLFFGGIVAFGMQRVGLWFNRLSAFEKWARLVTGVLFVLIGVYLSCIYIFGIAL